MIARPVIALAALAIVLAGGLARADGSARLAITTEPDAAIAIDGAPSAATATLGAGQHVVVVTRRGRVPIVRIIELEFGDKQTLALPLEETDQRRIVPYVVAGAGALGLGAIVASAFAASASSTASRIERERETTGITAAQLDQYQRAVEHRDRDVVFAVATGIGALVAGATALGLYWFDDRPAIVVQPGGVAVVGRF